MESKKALAKIFETTVVPSETGFKVKFVEKIIKADTQNKSRQKVSM